jgi:ATP-dependent Clp protease protease subunit
MAKAEKDKEKERDDFRTLDDKIDNVLLESRRIFFFDQVDNATARSAIRKLWYLELTNPGKPITFIINSPGGSIDAGFSIWDQVKMITSPVITLVSGLAASMGSVLSLCASKGKRFATPYSRFMIHQPSISGPVTGQATDLDIQAREILKTKDLLVNLYVEQTGRPRSEIEKALDRDTWMSAQEALQFGHIDRIVTAAKELQ